MKLTSFKGSLQFCGLLKKENTNSTPCTNVLQFLRDHLYPHHDDKPQFDIAEGFVEGKKTFIISNTTTAFQCNKRLKKLPRN